MTDIIVAGDFSAQKRVASAFATSGFEYVLKNVQGILNGAYSIVNLESPVVGKGGEPIKKTGPNLRCTVGAVEALKYAGFDCVTLANNHFYDYGEVGVEDTLEACASNGIEMVGGGRNIDEATRILYKRIGDKCVAVINVCEHEWSIASERRGGSAPLNVVKNYYQIREARERADYVLVVVHGGTEHYNLPTPRMKETYRFFVDAGADVVVNHHQHCYSGYEEYKGKCIFYGLGNFCFDKGIQKRDFWNEGYLVKLKFSSSIDFEIIPYVQCAEEPTIDFNIDKEEFFRKIEELNKLIADDDLLEKSFEKLVRQKEKGYVVSLEPYSNRYLKALRYRGLLPSLLPKFWYRYLLAIFRCEAHRDIVLRILEKKIEK